jgi:hypothetical protein
MIRGDAGRWAKTSKLRAPREYSSMGAKRGSNAEGSACGQERSSFGLPAVALAAATFAAAIAAKTTTPTTTTLGFGACFIDIDAAAADLASVQARDCFLAVFVVGHFNESEAPRTSGIAVHHDADAIHWPVCFEGLPEFVLIRVEAEIADKNIFHESAPALSCWNASSFRWTGRPGELA